MKIFIAGGTGVLGKRLVPLLSQDHQVAVLCRSKEKSTMITEMGATPVEVDIFDKDEILKKASGYDIYIHTATSIPGNIHSREKHWEMNYRLRTEGLDNLIEVAKKSNCTLFIKESVNFHYGHRLGEWVDEDTPITVPIQHSTKISQSLNEIVLMNAYEMENKLIELSKENNFPVIILRYGWFYSHDSSNVEMLAKRQMPIIGDGKSFWNMIHVEDAALAIIATIEHHEDNLGEIFNIVDNEPVMSEEFVQFGTELATGKSPRRVPKFLAKIFVGSYIVNFMTSSRKISNSKAKERLNWKPIYPTYREGLSEEIMKYNQNQDE